MAIIYTYPKLQNPQGNELIVVSDVNNKNATRLITIADIASLVPGGGGAGCSTAITGIVDNAGVSLYSALACSDMSLVSSDNSISISTNANNDGINITTVQTPLECAETTVLGGIKIASQYDIDFIPGPVTSDFTTLPIEKSFSTDEPGQSCTAIVRIPNTTQYQLPCATIDAIGGIKIGAVDEAANPVTGTGTAIALEANANCEGFVRIPSIDPYVLPCAGATTLGGIKAGKVTIEVPAVAESGAYYPIETVEDDCTAVVRVPSSASITCATTESIGGIIVGSAGGSISPTTTENPATAYAVEVNNNCEAYVQVPNSSSLSCATSTTLGGVKIASAISQDSVPSAAGSGTLYPVQKLSNEVGTDCTAVVRVPDSTTPETVKIGFSPMSIYEARNQIAAVSQTYWIQHVINSETLFNKVDYWSLNGGITGQLTVGVYSGNLDTFASSNATLIAYGTADTIAVGVNTINLTTAANGASVPPGQDVVVMVSRDTEGPAILGIPGNQYPLAQAKLSMKTPGYLVSTGLSLGDTITTNLQTLLNASGQETAVGASVDRFALHFYLKEDGSDSKDEADSEEESEGG
tara:strand:- start:26 stop:1768 length:1743 start_codon:yes stop_codon:yes gene_type:complete